VKRFGATTALDALSFAVAPGELFGLVGPDGAGKTTLFRVLTTLLLPDAGRATVLGLDVGRDLRALRARVGYMPGRFALYADLSVEENLAFFASVFGTRVADGYDIIAPIYRQLERFRDRRAGALSGGMKQKLALSCALVHRPDILFLDEPTTGVDAVVCPTSAILPPLASEVLADHELFRVRNLLALRNTRMANLLGLASVSVPSGVASCGLMLSVPPGREAQMLTWAQAALTSLA